ncbi:MAG: tRNA 2-thiouridine(34) synthase MnmA [Patescibacteria group bacterium]|nr:MAG: tRNA 2-thiouridine(34) synthase MnmA [Patescibacteria group bacterium]
MREKKEKVFIGLSGGVDSSVAAAILQKEGYDVTGVFIRVWQPPFLPCTWKEDRLDAMRVAAHLDIPFLTMNFEKEYKKEVVDYMIDAYKRGLTPNPDVMCNRTIKFGAFWREAVKMGALHVATGHHARTRKIENKRSNIKNYRLLKGVDEGKDQSYFLWTLTQKQLQKTLFPVGEYEKSDVRKMAEEFGLHTAQKKDSQGLCFVGKLNMRDFLKHFIEEKRGDVLNVGGEVIGWHEGAYFYTLGQRHGFTITKKGAHDTPYYIVGKNIEHNTLAISHKKTSGVVANTKRKVTIKNTNWIADTPLVGKKIYAARVRYRQPLQQCTVKNISDDEATIVFDEPQLIPAGQSLVLYDGEECLGGGIMKQQAAI